MIVVFELSSLMNGTGATENYNITSLLGLPTPAGNTNNHNRSVYNMYSMIIEAAEETVKEALIEEVRLQYESENREMMYSSYCNLPESERALYPVGINISFDMGWNKRSSGNQYNSLSGHGFAIGQLSKKIIGVQL